MNSALLWIALLSSPLIVSGETPKLKKLSGFDFTEEELGACRDAMQIYASRLSAYINCTLTSLHPSSMCTKCKSLYLDAADSYSFLDEVVSSRKNVTCKDLYVSNSELHKDSQFIQSSIDDTVEKHSKFSIAKCIKCYQEGNVSKGNLVNGLPEFFTSYDKLTSCYKDFYHAEGENGPKHPLCQSCRKDYDSFMNLYHEKFSNNDTSLKVLSNMCLDVTDRVLLANEVFDDFGCRITIPISTTMLVVAIVSMIAPLLFYVPFIYMCLTDKQNLSEGLVHASLVQTDFDEGDQVTENEEYAFEDGYDSSDSSDREFGEL